MKEQRFPEINGQVMNELLGVLTEIVESPDEWEIGEISRSGHNCTVTLNSKEDRTTVDVSVDAVR